LSKIIVLWDTHWPKSSRCSSRLVKRAFNNQSEAVREAIRHMQRQETDYLTPSPLTPAQVEAIYGREDQQADTVGRGASGRLAGRRGKQASRDRLGGL
jgi:Arc/MetJ-type ribon-helix-helix transcriptional regulator